MWSRLEMQGERWVAGVMAVLSLSGCRSLPSRPPLPAVRALAPAERGVLAEVAAGFAQAGTANESGFLLVPRNDDAMNWRLALIDHATTSIDAQYFIWNHDASGTLLFDRLLKAADRGVRVRLLVDNLYFTPSNQSIAALSRHPNLDLAIFNPQRVRNRRPVSSLEFLFGLRELNRRMHNKLFVVDGRMAIVGGRNIGDHYFGLSKKYNFRDLDVLVTGSVLEELSRAFDEYWNADFSFPGSALDCKNEAERLEAIRRDVADTLERYREVLSAYPLEPRQWHDELLSLPARMKRGQAHFVQDEPVRFGQEKLRLLDMLGKLTQPSHTELIIVSPYLIPGPGVLDRMEQLSSEGVDIRILAPSMGSNNHTVVHSHYRKYRRRLLARGELYEFKHDPSPGLRAESDVPPVRARFISLHVKAGVGDRQRCFIGSLNLDPRAVRINTENGLYIESPELSQELAEYLETLMAPENAWRVTLDEKNTLSWESDAGIVTRQPARRFSQRVSDFFYRLLPIEGQL